MHGETVTFKIFFFFWIMSWKLNFH